MYKVGQRWLSEAETDLGLGLVQSADFRSVTVYFPTIDDVRTYAQDNAPLTRVIFKAGDTVPLLDGSTITIEDVEEIEGIAFYLAEGKPYSEIQLSGHIQLSQPADRLFSGQIDGNSLYELRQQCFQQITQLRQRPYFGLLGARTSLLPHQLYISQQVTQDSLPRVLLADEVGLGKTIEAGLIMHRLLLQQRVSRVLVLVPDHLLHQWLVEMVRRFNLHFKLLQQADLDDEDLVDENLFADGQLYLVPLGLSDKARVRRDMMQMDWDMLVVDEAHHLQWSEDGADERYQLVDELAAGTPSILLLTATPEQLGVEGHFARLRLLDPERYPSLVQFLAEQEEYQGVAQLAGSLADEDELTDQQSKDLSALLPDLTDETDSAKLLEALIDRRGPGRAMFRNTRNGVSGFPGRNPAIHLFDCPEYASEMTFDSANPDSSLFPEAGVFNWCEQDPRVEWLLDKLKQTGKEKIVLICHHADTVLELEAYLWKKAGIQCAVFHEHMGLVERDRAAAYFADMEQGARLLLCSEIGSEGRNFQFAHELVLFDLPFNCDLIEQRIGRLDRIGQSQSIQIDALGFNDHPTGRWANICHSGLEVFSHPNPASQSLLEKNKGDILQAMAGGDASDSLCGQLASESQALQQELESGRDRLLELHSCQPGKASALAKDMTITHIEDEAVLNDFIDLFSDAVGIEMNDLGNDCISLLPGEHMLVPDLPHLPEDGFMATTRRDVALARDDVQFLSWEHPFIDQAMELITSSTMGNASVGYIESHPYQTGDCIIQLQFVAQCPAPRRLQVERYLPLDAMHLSFTPKGDLKVNEPELSDFVMPLKKGTARGLVEQKAAQIRPLIDKLEAMGAKQLGRMIERAETKAKEAYEGRVARIRALAEHNPNIPDYLVRVIEDERDAVLDAIADAQLQMDSIRLVFCS